MHSSRLIVLANVQVLPASHLGAASWLGSSARERRLLRKRLLLAGAVMLAVLTLVLWSYMAQLRPGHVALPPDLALTSSVTSSETSSVPILPQEDPAPTLPQEALAPALPAWVLAPAIIPPQLWQPDPQSQERAPSDRLPIRNHPGPIVLRVLTLRARVTAYTPYDHAQSHPQWADGLVAWYPGGRKRNVQAHPWGLATDWSQFPGGATWIRVPGYAEAHNDLSSFILVDDKCGRSRTVARGGGRPIIDARFLNRRHAVGTQQAWNSRDLDVEVVFPDGYRLPSSLRRWVVACEWRTYENGTLTARAPAPLP